MRILNRRYSHIYLTLSLPGIFYILGGTGCQNNNTKIDVNNSSLNTHYPARFPMARNGKIGFINIFGKETINAQYEEAHVFSEGLGAVLKSKKWGYIDPDGKLIISYQFDQVGAFSEHLAPVKINGRWGYIDQNGKFKITPQFDYAQPFKNTLAAVELSGRWGFIGKTGKLQINPQFEFADHSLENSASLSFNDGLCSVPEIETQQDNNETRFGYIDTSGKWAISPQFDSASDFQDKLAPTESGDRWGYIDTFGKFQVSPQFDFAQTFTDGLGLVKLGDRYGFVDNTGQYSINPQYDDAKPFSEDLAAVEDNSKWGYIDVHGKYAINPQFDEALSFMDGLAIVRIKTRYGYIDHNGKFVWGPLPVVSLYKAPPPTKPSTYIPVPIPQNYYNSDQIMPESTYRILTINDLSGKTDWQLTLMRNEIFARHGLIFNRNELNSYFLNKTWYKPLSPDTDAVMGSMSMTEKQNAVFIRDYQRSVGVH